MVGTPTTYLKLPYAFVFFILCLFLHLLLKKDEVKKYDVLSFRLGAVMCMGVTAGAYILTVFAVSCSHSLWMVHMLCFKVIPSVYFRLSLFC